jgi:hypothetical protein
LRRIVKVIFYSISLLVWVLILGRIFMGSNHSFEKELILLNENAAQIYPHTVSQVTRINSSTEDQSDSRVQVRNPIYLSEAKNLQFTVRANRRTLPAGDGELGYCFVLRESGKEESVYYPLSYYAKEDQFNYSFYRVCFEGVSLKDDCIYTFLLFPEGQENADWNALSAKDALFQFTIRNKDTYCNSFTPSASDFKTVEEMK